MFTPAELSAFLDEGLPPESMAAIETAVRADPAIAAQLAEIIARRDAGLHSLGEIWRRNRLTCPTRQQLGSHLLGILSDDESAYIAFHVDSVGCRLCRANLDDLKNQQAEAVEQVAKRRRKYFQSSAGHLTRAKH